MYGIETFIGCLHSEKDIAILIDLCRNNMLPRVRRRLNNFERKKIRNGSIFVYEEDESKIKRWTDGKIWSPSRCSGLFLVYTEYLPRSVNSKVLVKKTITANLKGSVYHVIAYVNLDEELNGMCCLKYGNRLRIVHTHCQSIKNTQKENLNDNWIDEKRNDDCDLFDNICQNDQNVDPYINQKQMYINNEQNDDLQNIDQNISCTDNLLIEKQIKNDHERGNINSENKTITKDQEDFTNFLPQTDMPIFQINDDCIFNDEYFYLENPLYKKMNQCNSIDSNENE